MTIGNDAATPRPGWWQDAQGDWHEGPRPGGVSRSSTGECPVCGRAWGRGVACQFCGQVEGLAAGVQLSSVGRRLGGYVLETAIALITLGLPWLIWALIVFGRGQTPAKQLLGMRTVNLRSGVRAGWGRMFLREFVAKGLIGLIILFTFGIGLVLYFWLLWDDKNQELWDKIVDTVVVNDPRRQLA